MDGFKRKRFELEPKYCYELSLMGLIDPKIMFHFMLGNMEARMH